MGVCLPRQMKIISSPEAHCHALPPYSQPPSPVLDHISTHPKSHISTLIMNATSSSGDWENRYYHVDQVLDRPGPRTDPSFLAGDEVCSPHPRGSIIHLTVSTVFRSKSFWGTNARSSSLVLVAACQWTHQGILQNLWHLSMGKNL